MPTGDRRARAARGSTIRAAWAPGTNQAIGDLGDVSRLVRGGVDYVGANEQRGWPAPGPNGWALTRARIRGASPDSRFPVYSVGLPGLPWPSICIPGWGGAGAKRHPRPRKRNLGGKNPDRWGQSPLLSQLA